MKFKKFKEIFIINVNTVKIISVSNAIKIKCKWMSVGVVIKLLNE